jgi:hypothetical protein
MTREVAQKRGGRRAINDVGLVGGTPTNAGETSAIPEMN